MERIRHNLPMKILSVVIAILFWFMVYTNENPIETRNLVIQLTPVNEETLADENLRILNEYDKEAEITIRGRKTEIDKVSAADFSAYLDFSSIENKDAVFIEITDFKYIGDRNINSELVGSGRVGLSVDHIVAGEIPIDVEIIGETAEGFSIAGKPVIHPSSFTVVDTSGLVTQIDTVIVTVDVSGMRGTEIVRMFCSVLDENGNEISEYKNSKAVDITINIAKSVPVNVKLEGVPAQDYITTGVTPNPSRVLVSGVEDELAAIEKVSTLPVNVEDAEEAFSITTSLQTLPGGLGYVGSGEVEIDVAIEKLQEKTINFSQSNINIRYGLEDKQYDIQSKSIELVVKGLKSILDAINPTNIKAYIDVGNTHDGEISLPLYFENLAGVEQINFPLVDLYIQTIKNIAVYTDDIFIENKSGGNYDYELLNIAASLQVIGLSENIGQLSYDSLKPTINAENLDAGTHTVPIQVTLPDGVALTGNLTTLLKITDK